MNGSRLARQNPRFGIYGLVSTGQPLVLTRLFSHRLF
jgi:hypothetical protein